MVNISFHSTDKKQEWVGVDRGWALRHFSYRHTQKALSFPSFMWLCFIRNFQQCGFLPERWENCTLPNPTREGCFCYRIEIKYVDEKEKKKKGRKNGTRYILRLYLSLFKRRSCWKERKKTINADTTLIISVHEDQPVHDLVLSKKICAFYKNS